MKYLVTIVLTIVRYIKIKIERMINKHLSYIYK